MGITKFWAPGPYNRVQLLTSTTAYYGMSGVAESDPAGWIGEGQVKIRCRAVPIGGGKRLIFARIVGVNENQFTVKRTLDELDVAADQDTILPNESVFVVAVGEWSDGYLDYSQPLTWTVSGGVFSADDIGGTYTAPSAPGTYIISAQVTGSDVAGTTAIVVRNVTTEAGGWDYVENDGGGEDYCCIYWVVVDLNTGEIVEDIGWECHQGFDWNEYCSLVENRIIRSRHPRRKTRPYGN